jgi:hypothetical protein
MTDKPENQVMADTQPAYDPPQALRMGDIHAGAGGILCEAGSGIQGPCQAGIGATPECLANGDGALNCNDLGNSPQNSVD